MYLPVCSVMQEHTIQTAVLLVKLTVSYALLAHTAILEQLNVLSVDLAHTIVVKEWLTRRVVMFVASVFLELSTTVVVLHSAISVMQEHTTPLMVQHLRHNALLVQLVHTVRKLDKVRNQQLATTVPQEHTARLMAQLLSLHVLGVQQEHIPIHLGLVPYHNVKVVQQEHTAM